MALAKKQDGVSISIHIDDETPFSIFDYYDYIPILWLPPSAYYKPPAAFPAAKTVGDYKWCSDTDDSETEFEAATYGEYSVFPYDMDDAHVNTPRSTPSPSPIPSPGIPSSITINLNDGSASSHRAYAHARPRSCTI